MLNEKILEFLQSKDNEVLVQIFEEYYPIDIAIELEELGTNDFLEFVNLLSPEQLSSIVEEADEEEQIKIIENIDPNKTLKVFYYMSTDDIADILGNLQLNYRKTLLNLMQQKDSKELTMLLNYGDETAGGIMTTEYIVLRSSLTIEQALKKIKAIAPRTEVIETLFIVDKSNKLIGTADIRDILVNPEEMLLEEITNENFKFVFPETDQEEVSLLVSKYDLKVIPVVNRKMIILGIITVDDIIDVIFEEQTEDMLMMSGVSKDETTDSTLLFSVQKRLPWLLINLATAFLAAFVVSIFEDTISQVVALAVTMPIVAGMGGNAGTQSLSIAVRGIALGEINLQDDWQRVFKEVLLGCIDGFVTGVVTGIILFFMYGNIYLSIIIVLAMVCNLIIAGFFGYLIPLVLKKFNLDPAISSSIFLTTFTDVFGFFIFLYLAKLFLPHLI